MKDQHNQLRVFDMSKRIFIGVCLVFLAGGCSSRLQTTITSGNEPEPRHIAEAVPVELSEEEVTSQRIKAQGLPVEPPAEPKVAEVMKETRDISAQSPSSSLGSLSQRGAPLGEAQSTLTFSEKETFSPSGSSVDSAPVPSHGSSGDEGIPPIAFAPEPPALPSSSAAEGPSLGEASSTNGSLTGDGAGSPSSSSEEQPVQMAKVIPGESDGSESSSIGVAPEPTPIEEPIQVAKVMPSESQDVKISEKALDEALNDVFFDYDRFVIRADAEALLRTNAELLNSKFADKQILIEGHCDERGTQSYNMVLGKRRAESVKSFLEDLGISSDKIHIVSFGKDRPFCSEQTPECYQENRRGHFVLK